MLYDRKKQMQSHQAKDVVRTDEWKINYYYWRNAKTKSEMDGMGDDMNSQIASLNAQITTLTNDKTALQSQISTLQSEKNALQTQVTNLTADKASLQSQITDLNNQITSLNSQITSLNAQIATLTAKVPVFQPINQLSSLTADTKIMVYLNATDTFEQMTYIKASNSVLRGALTLLTLVALSLLSTGFINRKYYPTSA